jgi:UDP-N-acetylmuramate dehydrogenase
MNFALGIPGHLGGAVAMNAGSHLGSMADVIASLKVLTAQGQFVTLDRESLNWSYRNCELPSHLGPGAILVEVELLLTPGDNENLRAEARDIMKSRVARQPIGMSCAGSFFKNPAPDIAAGRLIDAAGLKGLTVGRAQVSQVHANFIVNLGGATAKDVLGLKDQIQTAVWQQFAVELIPEVHIVGEAVDP